MVQSYWYGHWDYKASLAVMEHVAGRALSSGTGHVLGFEYSTTITMGLRASKNQNLPASIASIPVVPVSRGGLATIHNRGQVVIYPVVPIKKYDISVKRWVDILLNTTEQSLIKCNIIVINKKAGLFTEMGKIASVGIGIKRGVSTHGIAINLSNNLHEFSHITPCGIVGARFDRINDHFDISMADYFDIWTREFNKSMATYVEQPLTKQYVTP